MILVDPHSGVPVYRQVVDQIRFQVAGGQLASGQELPSTRTLSLQLGVNPMTISKAYGILEAEGILVHRPGLPLVVRPQSRQRAGSAKRVQLEEVLKPAVVAAIQLGFDPDEAAAVFEKLVATRHAKAGAES